MNHVSKFDIGSEVRFLGRPAVVTAQSDVDEVIVQFRDSGETKTANVSQLAGDRASRPGQKRAVDAVPPADMDLAKERYRAIEPLLEISRDKGQMFKSRAEETGYKERTLRRWVAAYADRGLLSDLAPNRRKKRKRRLSKKVEAVIQDVVERVYLTKQKPSAKMAIDEIIRLCKAARIKPPHPNTVRSRLQAVSEKEKVRRRHGKKSARDKFGEVKAAFPDGNFPLETVQIDHTKLDIELVDDDTRQPIGRPWITVAIDVFSRMIVGYYISLDAPSSFSVGMCIRHAVLHKDEELARLGVKGKWPVWGLMRTLHADNGKDFRSGLIQTACDEYGISIAWRPVKQPHFGGHVERLMGTIANEIHTLPGTTFSNVRDKGEYDSAKNAVMTLNELQRWFVTWTVGVYHQRLHKGIDQSPIEKWREGILGTDRKKGTGLPKPIGDPDRFGIDFLPFDHRTVQRDGISWDGVQYLSPAITHWIGAKKGGRSAKFLVRRDPRDISRIYFLDPDIGEYLDVPYRNLSRPSISVWELRAAKSELRRRNAGQIDEDAIFAAVDSMREISETAAADTRTARRDRQKNKQHAKNKQHTPEVPKSKPPLSLVVDNVPDEDDEGEFDISDEELVGHWEDWS